ncbi:MAG: hypothetical protein R3E97_13110 [Candidatus Eisenbacteria bacterium]
MEVHGRFLEHHVIRLDLREVQDVADQSEQSLTAGPDRLDMVLLQLGQRLGLAKEAGHTDDPIHRRTEFMAHVREEGILGLRRRLGGDESLVQPAILLFEECLRRFQVLEALLEYGDVSLEADVVGDRTALVGHRRDGRLFGVEAAVLSAVDQLPPPGST